MTFLTGPQPEQRLKWGRVGYAPRALLAAGLGFAVSFLVACGGGSNLLSGDESSSLNGKLDRLAAAVDAGQCGGAARAAASFANSVSNLPGTVSPTLRANLLQGASTVNDASQRDCRTTTTAPTTTPSTTSTTPSSTTTTPSSTSTTTSSTTTTTTPSSTTTTPATSTTTPGTTSTPTSTTGGAGVGGATTTTSGGASGGGPTGQ